MTHHRRAWIMQLKPGAEAAYDAAHKNVWPELTRQMRADGVVRFNIYRSGLTVFAIQERVGPFPPTSATPSDVAQRWWHSLNGLMVADENDRPIRTELTEVFALEGQSPDIEAAE